MTEPHTDRPAVAVLGLGAMGRALARAFLDAGHPTTVWNRSAGRAAELLAAGAVEALSAADALATTDVAVICVLDSEAVGVVLDAAGSAVAGRAVVNLTSATPEDARSTADRVTGAGGRYLDGAIMVPTPLVGTADGLYLYSGDPDVFAEHGPTLAALGGNAELLGDDPGLAALHDLGMLDIFFNGMAAFLHAVALVGADGVPAVAFLPYAQRILEVLTGTLPGLAADADRGTYPGDEDNLAMELAALEHIVEASANRGVDPALPDLVRRLAATAVAEGHGADGFSRVVDLLRNGGRSRLTAAGVQRD